MVYCLTAHEHKTGLFCALVPLKVTRSWKCVLVL